MSSGLRTNDEGAVKPLDVGRASESDHRFRVLADAAPVLIWMSDAAGKGTLFNRQWLEFTGRAFEEELGDGWTECIHPDDRGAALLTCAAGKRRGQPFRMELRMRRADGTYRWMLDTGVPRFAADGTLEGYIGSCVDVTDRREATEAVREAESRLRTITDAVPVLISYVCRDRRYRLNNRAYEEWFGRPRNEVTGRSVEEVVGPAAWSVVGPRIDDALAGRTTRFEAEVDYRGGGRRWIDATYVPHVGDDGDVEGVVVLVQDVSQRKRAEDALLDREERLRSIVEAAGDAIVTIDAAGAIDSFNPAAQRMFGYRPDEVLGRDVRVLMPARYRDPHDAGLAARREAGERRPGALRRLAGLRKDGTELPIELSVSEIDHTGRFTAILRDVSEREALQAEREALQDALLTATEQEQRRIGQDLHDDVGQELTGLGLSAETLLEALEEYDLPEAALAARIVAGLRRAHAKVRALSHGLIPVEVDAGGLMAALAELTARSEFAGGARCAFECPRPVAVPDGRVATQLYRIAQEAVSNAVRHGRPRHVRISLSADDGQVALDVRDDGVGIGATAAGGGGLRIMRHRAELIGASLEIGPAAGGGTQVTCVVPASPREAG